MASIQLCGVSKVYRGGGSDGLPDTGQASSRGTLSREIHAVEGVDLEVRSGELLVLMGPSGSGKTTLLRLIAGLEEPSAGSVQIDGRDQHGIAARDRNIAMVFQGPSLYGHLTARENLTFGLHLRSGRSFLGRWIGNKTQDQSEVDQAVQAVADLLGIQALLGKRPGELSGGEQQRVAIGRALIRKPRVFLLDEPLASLDGPTRLALRREIRQLQQRLGVTTIYVTHDQGEALALGDRIGVLRHGRLQQLGTPDEVYRHPRNRSVASLFGNLGMNLIPGEVINQATNAEWVSGQWRLPIPERIRKTILDAGRNKVDLGIRPEDLTAAGVDAATGPGQWPATVEGIEYQGSVTYVRAAGGQPPAVLARRVDDRLQAGEAITLQMETEKVCWFDAETGANLSINTAE